MGKKKFMATNNNLSKPMSNKKLRFKYFTYLFIGVKGM